MTNINSLFEKLPLTFCLMLQKLLRDQKKSAWSGDAMIMTDKRVWKMLVKIFKVNIQVSFLGISYQLRYSDSGSFDH